MQQADAVSGGRSSFSPVARFSSAKQRSDSRLPRQRRHHDRLAIERHHVAGTDVPQRFEMLREHALELLGLAPLRGEFRPRISCTNNIACSIMMSFRNIFSATEWPCGHASSRCTWDFSRGLKWLVGGAPIAATVGRTWAESCTRPWFVRCDMHWEKPESGAHRQCTSMWINVRASAKLSWGCAPRSRWTSPTERPWTPRPRRG